MEYDENFMPIALRFLENMPAWSNEYNRNRLATTPQAEFVREWTLEDLADTPPETNGANNIRANRDAASPSQTKLDI